MHAQVIPDSLEYWGNKMLNDPEETTRIESGKIFSYLLDSCLKNENSFRASFEEIKSMSALEAPDKKFRLYTWNTPLDDGTYLFFGRFQASPKSGYSNKIIRFTDKSEEIKDPESKKTGPEKWYGALYYKIIHTSYRKKHFYTLLGWDGNTDITDKKLMDVLTINENGSIQFGAPIFEKEKRLKHRLLFEYRQNVPVTLNYQDKKGLIIMDHLSPSDPKQVGIYAFYGPDFSYDAYRFSKGQWRLIQDFDARNEDENKGNTQKKPERGLSPKK